LAGPISTDNAAQPHLETLLERAWQTRLAHSAPTIQFDHPVDTAIVSLTGTQCALDCAHCGRHYLRHMIPIWQAADRLAETAPSVLVSGGCDAEGRVPVLAHLEQVAALRPGRRLNWHVGLIGEAEARAIAPYADAISLDFVGDDETIRQVYGLNKTVADYVASYQVLRRYAPVTPHITVGLRGGELGHERPALERLEQLGLDGLVFLVFAPTPGTRYADRQPPAVADVAAILAEARLRFPNKPIYLGCMRPKGRYRAGLDPLAVRAGVNKIVNPARKAVELAESLGLSIVRGRECCAL
jgi:uncharacterized radical SAM superfamily protein